MLEENKLALNLRACSEGIVLKERAIYLFKGNTKGPLLLDMEFIPAGIFMSKNSFH